MWSYFGASITVQGSYPLNYRSIHNIRKSIRFRQENCGSVSKTNPNSADTDGDGFSDGVELNLYSKGYDPLSYNANRPLPSITAL